jgi:PTH2 family peptidyl-tRNA hydrolase
MDLFYSEQIRTHKLVLVVRQDLGMGKGKIGAQCGHVSVLAYKQASPDLLREWDLIAMAVGRGRLF